MAAFQLIVLNVKFCLLHNVIEKLCLTVKLAALSGHWSEIECHEKDLESGFKFYSVKVGAFLEFVESG